MVYKLIQFKICLSTNYDTVNYSNVFKLGTFYSKTKLMSYNTNNNSRHASDMTRTCRIIRYTFKLVVECW